MLSLIKIREPRFANRVYKSRGSIWFPEWDVEVPKHQNILAVLDSHRQKFLIPGMNIVTNCGDIHYAQRGAAESVTNSFAMLYVATSGTPGKTATSSDFTIVTSSGKVTLALKTNDGDADNTGGGVDIVTWTGSWSKTDFTQAAPDITHGFVANSGDVDAQGAPILTGFIFASSFSKTVDDTLKVFVNHTMNGV